MMTYLCLTDFRSQQFSKTAVSLASEACVNQIRQDAFHAARRLELSKAQLAKPAPCSLSTKEPRNGN
jgi:hypothetical protein